MEIGLTCQNLAHRAVKFLSNLIIKLHCVTSSQKDEKINVTKGICLLTTELEIAQLYTTKSPLIRAECNGSVAFDVEGLIV